MKQLALISTLFLLALVMGCGSESSQETQTSDGDTYHRDLPDSFPAPDPGIVRINGGAEPPSLDPSLITDLPSFYVVHHLFEPLVRMDEKGASFPAAATEWSSAENNTVWTFKIREGMQWSDGSPVTANDWEYAIKRTLTRETQSEYAMMVYNFVKNGEDFYRGNIDFDDVGVKALDDLTLEVTLTNPTPYFVSNLSHSIWYPLHKKTIEAHGEAWSGSPDHYVANGPFLLNEIRPKDRIILTKNPKYWNASEIKFNQLEFLFIDNQSTEMAAFTSGDIDMTGQVNNREAAALLDEPELHKYPALASYYIAFNTTRPPFDDVNLRKAVSYSVHRQLIVDRITQRGEFPAVGFVPHGMTISDGTEFRAKAPRYYDSSDFEANVEIANQYLKEGGYGTSKDLPAPEYLFNTDLMHQDIAENLQNIWKSSINMDSELQKIEWGVLLKRGGERDFELLRGSWFGDYLDPLTFLEIFETGHGKNYVGYSNPVYDDLLKQIREESDPQVRLDMMIEAERLIIEEDCIIAPIFEPNTAILVRTSLKGFIRTPLGGMDLTQAYRDGDG